MFTLALILYGGWSGKQVETVSLDSPSYTCQNIPELPSVRYYVSAASISGAPVLCGGQTSYV